MGKKDMTARIEALAASLERVEAALVVRDPGNARSAEAFDGLRKQIAMAARVRRTHASHLVTLAEDLRKGATLETVTKRVRDFLNELGVRQSEDIDIPDAFVVEGEGEDVEIVDPAWVDVMEDGTRIVLKQGRATRRNGGQP